MEATNPEILFELIDPLGRRIILYEYVWSTHVVAKRPWMVQVYLEFVENAVAKPDFGIFQDNARPSRQVYYRLSDTRPEYMKVVVEFNPDGTGSIVTAFPTDSPKSEESIIWLAFND